MRYIKPTNAERYAVEEEALSFAEELTELTAEVRALHERLGTIAAPTSPQARAKARPNGDRDTPEDGQARTRERQHG